MKTLSVEDARASGHVLTSDPFLVRSERQIRAAVRSEGISGSILAGEEDVASLLPTAAEVRQMRARAISERLNDAFGPSSDKAVKDLLDARSCQTGWSSFVRLGAKYSRPPETREQRMQRMRLVIAAQELYDSEYAEGNPWSMGPFYYEDIGLAAMEAAARSGGA